MFKVEKVIDLEHVVPPSIRVSLVLASVSRSEEHTSELQSLAYLVCRLLLEKKKSNRTRPARHVLGSATAERIAESARTRYQGISHQPLTETLGEHPDITLSPQNVRPIPLAAPTA